MTHLLKVGLCSASSPQENWPPFTTTGASISAYWIIASCQNDCVPICMCAWNSCIVPEAGGCIDQSTILGSSSSFLRKFLRRFTETLAWTTLDMSMGSIERGKRRMLKRERATKALSAVSRSSGLLRFTRTYVANVARATYTIMQVSKFHLNTILHKAVKHTCILYILL